MKCPWLVTTFIQTNNQNSYKDSTRVEQQVFSKCVGKECPFYLKIEETEVCKRTINNQ